MAGKGAFPITDKINIHKGHRKRMKEEFLVRGLEGLPNHKVLELLLFYAIPQGDVNPLAHKLLQHFGSLSAVFNATHEQLTAVKGVGENTATLIQLVTAIGGRYLQDQVNMNDIFTHPWHFQELLAPYFFGARNEMSYLVCLDGKNKLIACKKLSEGDAFTTSFSLRTVMEAALNSNAATVVLAHNHVSGIALPSAEDRAVTRKVYKALKTVNIYLFDHYILVDGDMVSLRASGFFQTLEES